MRHQAETLLSIRQARLKSLRTSPFSKYTDGKTVRMELDRARHLCREYGWHHIDIGGKAVEENASRVIELYQAALTDSA